MTDSQDNQKETAPQPKSLHVPSKEAIEIAARILANRAEREGRIPRPSTDKSAPLEKQHEQGDKNFDVGNVANLEQPLFCSNDALNC